ncbi:hypothetical protein [Pedobacter mendelii]|nr:hypothetical protein [Pedobacter mendelii]
MHCPIFSIHKQRTNNDIPFYKPKLSFIGFQLGEVAEIEAENFNFAQKLNRRTTVEFGTKPAILPN